MDRYSEFTDFDARDQTMQPASQTRRSSAQGLLRCALSAALLLLMMSCGERRQTGLESTSPENPDWVHDLRDPLQDLPLLSASQSGEPIPSKLTPRLGEPEALGRRMGGGVPEVTGVLDGGAKPRGSGPPGPGIGFPRIDLNVITGAVSSAEDPVPETAELFRPSTLELAYRGELPTRPDRSLEQFGYESVRIWERSSRSSAPPSGDHRLGPGDEIIVDLVTDQARRFQPVVSENGTIEIPELGSYSVGGLTREEALSSLRNEIGRVRRNFELRVGFGSLVPVSIRVAGEVERGGVVQLDPRGDLLDVLGASGVRKSGSLRHIRVVRAGGDTTEIDLYGYLLGNEAPPMVRLAVGDSVLVPPIGPTVGVAGSVQRPAIYEMRSAESLTTAEVIQLAGGTTGFTLSDAVQIERTGTAGRELIDVGATEADQFTRDGDLILVGAVNGRLHPVVESSGALIAPGRFQYRDGMTVGDLVRMSGGLEVDAFPEQAVLSRLQSPRATRNTEYDAGTRSTSRRVMIINVERALAGDPEHDIELIPLDHLRLSTFQDAHEIPVVEIIGAVRRPGRYEQTAGLRVGDLLALSGNLTEDAHREQAELIRRKRVESSTTLDVDRFRIELGSVLAGRDRGPLLENGDQVVIRRMRRAEVRVRIDGLVRFPGEFVLPAGSSITDLIAAAGGLLRDADLRASRFTRISVRDAQLDRWEELAERNRQRIEGILEERVNSARTKEAASARIQLRQTESLLGRLRNQQVNGRVVVPFMQPGFPGSEFDLALEPGDSLFVPRRSKTVSVLGNVFNPLTVVHDQAITAESLIDQAGGLTELADEDRIYVVRADGRVEGVIQERGKFELAEPLLAGDVVLVPKRALDRDLGSVVLDLLLTARSAAEAAALWNLALTDIDESNLSLISPSEQRGDPNQMTDLLDEFQNGRR